MRISGGINSQGVHLTEHLLSAKETEGKIGLMCLLWETLHQKFQSSLEVCYNMKKEMRSNQGQGNI